ncbi:hypothetical protein ACFVZD_32360 [Streptomyces sp. NPDC058287]|uniref:hypothetical protein n=1 Tax=unclassified Streptomyces TaxID=2593676 RepID=UPI0036E76810
MGQETRASNEPIYYGLAAGLVAQVLTSLAIRPIEPPVLERWGHLLAGDVAETAGARVPTAGVPPAAL